MDLPDGYLLYNRTSISISKIAWNRRSAMNIEIIFPFLPNTLLYQHTIKPKKKLDLLYHSVLVKMF
jgi:hypothetical protein